MVERESRRPQPSDDDAASVSAPGTAPGKRPLAARRVTGEPAADSADPAADPARGSAPGARPRAASSWTDTPDVRAALGLVDDAAADTGDGRGGRWLAGGPDRRALGSPDGVAPVQRQADAQDGGHDAPEGRDGDDLWRRSRAQGQALEALHAETPGQPEGDARAALAGELRRQLPDLELVDHVASGQGKTVITLINPGSSPLGVKSMNDKLIGYALNSTELVPRQGAIFQQAFADAFAAVGAADSHVVVGNNYKGITISTSLTEPTVIAAVVTRAMRAIDVAMNALLAEMLDRGAAHWQAQLEAAEPGSPTAVEADERLAAIAEARASLGAPGWIYEGHVGAARVQDLGPGADGGAITEAALRARVEALQGRSMARREMLAAIRQQQEASPAPGREEARIQAHAQAEARAAEAEQEGVEGAEAAADPRFHMFDAGQLRARAVEADAQRAAFVDGGVSRTLTIDGVALALFYLVDGEWVPNPDIVRMYRKGQLSADAVPAHERALFAELEAYFDRTAVVSSMTDFTSDELPQVTERLAEGRRILAALRSGEPLSAEDRASLERLLREDVSGQLMAEAHRASEALFARYVSGRGPRIVINADIVDLGVMGRTSGARAVHAIAAAETTPDAAYHQVLAAGDPLTQFRRAAYARVAEAYEDALLETLADIDATAAAASGVAPAASRGAELGAELEAELAAAREGKVILMGGDELTLSAHPAVEPHVPALAARVATAASARVVVTEAVADAAAPAEQEPHARAMGQADAGMSILKKYEVLDRELSGRVERVAAPGPRAEARRMLDDLGLRRIYARAAPDTGEIALHRQGSGEVVDPAAFDARIAALEVFLDQHA